MILSYISGMAYQRESGEEQEVFRCRLSSTRSEKRRKTKHGKRSRKDREVFIFLGELLFAELNHTICFRVTINVSIPKVAVYFSHGYIIYGTKKPQVMAFN